MSETFSWETPVTLTNELQWKSLKEIRINNFLVTYIAILLTIFLFK